MVPPGCSDKHRHTYVIMTVADDLVPNRHQDISNHHEDSIETILSISNHVMWHVSFCVIAKTNFVRHQRCRRMADNQFSLKFGHGHWCHFENIIVQILKSKFDKCDFQMKDCAVDEEGVFFIQKLRSLLCDYHDYKISGNIVANILKFLKSIHINTRLNRKISARVTIFAFPRN